MKNVWRLHGDLRAAGAKLDPTGHKEPLCAASDSGDFAPAKPSLSQEGVNLCSEHLPCGLGRG